MLKTLDVLFTILHLGIIGFNLSGWIWPETRKIHLFCIFLTAGSWLGLGIWYGLGYCPVTDWQWQVKEKLGEQNLPNSFISYLAGKIFNMDINAALIDATTAVLFLLSAVLSIYTNFKKKPEI